MIARLVCNKLLKVNFNVTDTYISGDLAWAICFDSSQKKIAFFRIFKSTVDLYYITHIRKCEVEIFEGKTKRTISVPKILVGALTGRLISGKNTNLTLGGAAIGAATSDNLFGAQEAIIKQIFLYVVTSNNAYRINFKRLWRLRTNNNSVSEALRWNKLMNHIQ
ncbi:hypothetical protein WG904_02650 [Pedobacter sp. Du54]|uniref:hypothetical protein n=1 Tax=Pedobacter anseongensis TaxID=3133439 RepID=UPI00309A3293